MASQAILSREDFSRLTSERIKALPFDEVRRVIKAFGRLEAPERVDNANNEELFEICIRQVDFWRY